MRLGGGEAQHTVALPAMNSAGTVIGCRARPASDQVRVRLRYQFSPPQSRRVNSPV